MRASHIALILAVLAIPSVGYAQQDNGPIGGPVGGPVGSMVGPEGSSSPGQPRPSLGSPYGSPTRAGPVTGSTGAITAGQVGWRRVAVDGVPQNVRVTPRADGIGSAFINGQRVLVDLNTNRVLQQGNGPVGGSVGDLWRICWWTCWWICWRACWRPGGARRLVLAGATTPLPRVAVWVCPSRRLARGLHNWASNHGRPGRSAKCAHHGTICRNGHRLHQWSARPR